MWVQITSFLGFLAILVHVFFLYVKKRLTKTTKEPSFLIHDDSDFLNICLLKVFSISFHKCLLVNLGYRD